MAALTEEQKERFLELVALGWERQEAAHAVGESQSTFQILQHSDTDFRARVIRALNEGKVSRKRNNWEQPLSDSQIELYEDFLALVGAGKHPAEAAHELGYYLSYFMSVLNPFSNWHSPQLADRYNQALEEGRPLFMERIRRLWINAAEEGEYRAIRDLGIMHLPEAAVLRNSRVEIGNADGQAFRTAVMESIDLTGVPTELLQKLKVDLEEIERAKRAGEVTQPARLELLAGGEE